MARSTRNRNRYQRTVTGQTEGHQHLPARRAASLSGALDAAQHLARVIGHRSIALRAVLQARHLLIGRLPMYPLLAAARCCLGGIALRGLRVAYGHWARGFIGPEGRYLATLWGQIGGAIIWASILLGIWANGVGRYGRGQVLGWYRSHL
jgi:hypothetical protein